MLVIVAKRIVSHPGLMLAEILGLAVALALMVSIPMYADAVYYRLFLEDLFTAEAGRSDKDSTGRSPFTFIFNYNGSTYGSKDWDALVPVDTYLSEQAVSTLSLARDRARTRGDTGELSASPRVVRYFSTEPFGLFASSEASEAEAGAFDASINDRSKPLLWASFAFISDLEQHITLTEGRFPSSNGWVANLPQTESAETNQPVEVLVSEALAVELGLQVDELYTVLMRDRAAVGSGRPSDLQVPVEIAGIWRPTNPQSDFWFFEPGAFEERLLVTEEMFVERLSVAMTEEIYTAAWALLMAPIDVSLGSASGLGSQSGLGDRTGRGQQPFELLRLKAQAGGVRTDLLLDRALEVQQRAVSLLPDIKLVHSPLDVLSSYKRAVNLLMILLYAFSLPIFALLLAFVALTSGLFTEQRRNEIAVLRSRGAGVSQLVGTAVLESLLLGGMALLLGLPLGRWGARFIERTRSFLDFVMLESPGGGVDRAGAPALTIAALRWGMVGLALAMTAQVLPSLGAMRHTITSYKQERARLLRKPWWQRAGLDLLLLIPAAYGAYRLWMQGSIVSWGQDTGTGAAFHDPLLFLVPALGIFALTLFFLRFMPFFMRAIAWLMSHTRTVGLLMAARHLARSPRFYATPLVLLVLTLSLSAFTASLAYTLDHHLHDQVYYQIGADIVFVDLGENQTLTAGAAASSSSEGLLPTSSSTTGETGRGSSSNGGPRWLFLPVSEYLALPGVQAAMRVGRYPATTRVAEETYTGVFIGVERYNFSRIAFWREDFAAESLGALMNALAMTSNGVLVPQYFLEERFLQVGDRLRVLVNTYGQTNELDLNIVGTFDLFPTWYPEADGLLFVGGLDYLFQEAGGQFPYHVWLETVPDVSYAQLGSVSGLAALDWKASPLRITEQQNMPERQGLFGVLSVGFVAAALLTVLGFLLYALFSFRRRFIEFGVLRAVGLSTWQMTSFLGWELAFLIVMGGALGTALGVGVSSFFIPYLQVGAEEMARIPPYDVNIAWSAVFRVYGLFGLLFVVALIVLVVMLQRMKIFQAIKLGESA
jgi:putative ABC transport system permease protein